MIYDYAYTFNSSKQFDSNIYTADMQDLLFEASTQNFHIEFMTDLQQWSSVIEIIQIRIMFEIRFCPLQLTDKM